MEIVKMFATINAADLKRIIGATKAFVGEINRRPAVQFIRLRFSKEFNSVEATACDGYRVSIEHAACGTVDEDFVAYIKPSIPSSKKDDTAIIEANYGFCYIKINDSMTGYKQPTGEFTDGGEITKRTVESPPTFRVGFNGALLLSALQAALVSSGGSFKHPIALEFHGEVEPVVIRTNGKDIKLVMPLRLKNDG